MPLGPMLLGSVPCSLTVLSFSEGITDSLPLRKGAFPDMGFFSIHEAPDGPCPEPLSRQGVATC